ncbi:MAG: ATP-binding cassette domain-containing protein [Rhodopirellula sp.]|nr:ATP-binding cassette domain-containing protein [Rhodopirellula sp.]
MTRPQPELDDGDLEAQVPYFSYRSGRGVVPVLRDISFVAPSGKITAVMGRSGCGKTTLLRLLAGIHAEPTLRLRYRNQLLHPPHPAIGLVFQDYRLFPWKTVEGNILCAAQSSNQDPSAVSELIQEFRLTELKHQWPKTLSGGEQARVALARCLVQRPKILLLDEVFRSLDLQTRLDIFGTIDRLTRKLSLVTIVVTHDVDEARRIAEQVLVLELTPTTIGRTIRRTDSDGHSIQHELANTLMTHE